MSAYSRQDLHRALVSASKSMIRVKDPIVLLRLITRFIDRQIGATHVAVLLFDKKRGSYVLIDSKGEAGQRIPIGYIRVKAESPIVRYFHSGITGSELRFRGRSPLVYRELEGIRQFEILVNRREQGALMVAEIKKQMELLRAAICVPSYCKSNLVAVLILGEKLNNAAYEAEEISVFSTLANDVAMAVTNAELIRELKDSCDRERDLFIDTASALVSAIDARDRYTKGHSERVSHYTLVMVGMLVDNKKISFTRDFMEAAQLAGLLHDVGKIGIKDPILNKPSSLTDEEFKIMKTHVEIGINILKPIRGMKEIADGAKYHHEWWNGAGYPFGLKGDEIPVLGRIVAVADAYDTMVTSRPYQKARSPEEAFAELKAKSGTQFDPEIVALFCESWQTGAIRKKQYRSYSFSHRGELGSSGEGMSEGRSPFRLRRSDS